MLEKDQNEFKLHSDKHSEEVLIEQVVKTTIQILSDKGLFVNYDNTDELLKDYLPFEKRRPDLDPNI